MAVSYLVTHGLGDFEVATDVIYLISGGLSYDGAAPTTVVPSARSRFSAIMISLPFRGIMDLPGTPSSIDERRAVEYFYARGVNVTPPVSQGTFVLDISVLSGGRYRTVPFDMEGEFRTIQFHWFQDQVSQDMEPHYFEFHYQSVGVDEVA